jgi:hypothetical protein
MGSQVDPKTRLSTYLQTRPINIVQYYLMCVTVSQVLFNMRLTHAVMYPILSRHIEPLAKRNPF